MSLRKRLLFLCGFLVVAALLTALLAPFAVSRGLRAWLWWVGRREGLTIEVAKIDAPFLHVVTIDGFRVEPAEQEGRAVHLLADHMTLDLNFRGWIFDRRRRLLHELAVNHLRGSVSAGTKYAGEKLDWRNLQRLLPDAFRLADVDLDITTSTTAISFHGLQLSASEVESGRFFAQQISLASPILRQTFRNLRGATSWEGDRLTLAGLSLAPGLDLEALTIDLARLPKRQVGLDFQLDTFGGTLRGSFQGRGGGPKFDLDLTASAANVSLVQISSAAGLLEPLTGSVKAAQFTFRGNPGEFLDVTASVWIEVSGFAWRARRGNRLVFGGTYYNRRLQVEQLYVQQRPNELTVNGELLWPKTRRAWTALQFRGQLNATIPDANAFAQLFGAAPGDVAGALSAGGEINSLEPAARGQLAFRGAGLRWKGVALDSLGGTLRLEGEEVTLADLEIRRANDFLRGHGTASLTGGHAYSARLTGAINDLGEYAPLLPAAWRAAPIGGGVTFDWSGDGTFHAHSGTMQVFAHGLQLPVSFLRSPLDLTLEGTYSPQDVFFRTFKLADERFSLGGFLMLGRDFVELQALTLAVDGTPRATGTIFLPVSAARWRETGSLLDALDDQQKFDVDLTVDQLDLAAVATSLGEERTVSGTLGGHLAAYGPLPKLQLTTDWHLRNFGPATVPNALDLELRSEGGTAEANLRATFGVSSPANARMTLPLQLSKTTLRTGEVIRPNEPWSIAIDCPALFLAALPEVLQPVRMNSGVASGSVAFAGTVREPQLTGAGQLLDVKLSPRAPWPAVAQLSADLSFAAHAAEITTWRAEVDGWPMQGTGSFALALPFYTVTLAPLPGTATVVSSPTTGNAISAVRILGEGSAEHSPPLERVLIRGEIGAPDFSLTTTTPDAQTTLFSEPGAGAPLLLNFTPISVAPFRLQP